MVFAGFSNDLAVERVLDTALNQHSDCFGSLSADNFTDQGAFE
jgi:hypothetical protein